MTRSLPRPPTRACGEIHVGGEHRPLGDLQDDLCECFVDREDGGAVAVHSGGAELRRQRLPERAGGGDRAARRVTGREADDDVEPGVLGQQHQQTVEHGQPGVDVRAALTCDLDSHPDLLGLPARAHPSVQGIAT